MCSYFLGHLRSAKGFEHRRLNFWRGIEWARFQKCQFSSLNWCLLTLVKISENRPSKKRLSFSGPIHWKIQNFGQSRNWASRPSASFVSSKIKISMFSPPPSFWSKIHVDHGPTNFWRGVEWARFWKSQFSSLTWCLLTLVKFSENRPSKFSLSFSGALGWEKWDFLVKVRIEPRDLAHRSFHQKLDKSYFDDQNQCLTTLVKISENRPSKFSLSFSGPIHWKNETFWSKSELSLETYRIVRFIENKNFDVFSPP